MSSLGKVIVLSGPSSSGKSTLSKAIQALLDVPYWHISLDMIWYMQPPQREDPNWYPTSAAELMKAFSRTVGMLSRLGINVIAETGFLDPSEIVDFLSDLPEADILFVGVFCTLEIEKREVIRPDREVGYSRGHYDRVHSHSKYDIQVDTNALTPEQAAAKVKAALDQSYSEYILTRIRKSLTPRSPRPPLTSNEHANA